MVKHASSHGDEQVLGLLLGTIDEHALIPVDEHALIPVDEHAHTQLVPVKPCTSESYEFVNIPFGVDRGVQFLDVVVAVVDGCRRTSQHCNGNELTFLSDPRGLVDYTAVSDLCPECSAKSIGQQPCVGINSHGFFCAAIIASRKIPEAQIGDVYLGAIRGVSPPPFIALYAVGCPSCFNMKEQSMVEGITAAIRQRVDVISMSLAREFPSDESSSDFHAKDMSTLEALRHDILTVSTAGNLGKYGLRTIAKTAPWCLTVASCTPRRKFRTKISFGGHVIDPFDIEVESMNMISSDPHWGNLRRSGEIYGLRCRMFLHEDSVFYIEASSETATNAPSATVIVDIPRHHSITICDALCQVDKKNEELYVQVASSVKIDIVNSPLPSVFSGRGPCNFFKDFMKPDLCAPGEEIAAAWPSDEPLGGFGPPHFAKYNVLSGTSFAAPQVAAAIAILRAEKKFSATATFSAVITTAKKMHGKDHVAREFAYGAGMLDIKRAMRPGFVYEESAKRHKQCFDGELSHLVLNLPYLSATFPVGDAPWSYVFKRRVKSVEVGRCSYAVKIQIHSSTLNMPREFIDIEPSISRLTFEDFGELRHFSVEVRLPHTRVHKDKFGLISGSLIWENEGNKEVVVDSPILLSSREIPHAAITEQQYM